MPKKLPKITDRYAQQRIAIQYLIITAGSQKTLGESLGVTQAAISKWLIRGWVPLQRAQEIEAIYGMPRTAIADPAVVEILASVESMLGR